MKFLAITFFAIVFLTASYLITALFVALVTWLWETLTHTEVQLNLWALTLLVWITGIFIRNLFK